MTNEELVMEIQAGRDLAENLVKLWEQNQGAIWQQARKYAGLAEMDDLLQEGYLAMHRAALEYDPGRGASFITMLLVALPRALHRYVGQLAALKIPEQERRNIAELDQMEKSFLAEHGRYPTNWEACRELGISQEKLQQIRRSRSAGYVDSLDRTIDMEDVEVALMDAIPAPDSALDAVEDKIYHDSLKAAIWGAVGTLEPCQVDVICRRYVDDQTLQATGEAHGEDIGWARRTEAKALRKLGSGANRLALQPFLDEYIYNGAIRGVGAARFRQTLTSATEREALQRIGD